MSLGAWLGEALRRLALFVSRLVRLVLSCLLSSVFSKNRSFCNFDSNILKIQLRLYSRKPRNVFIWDARTHGKPRMEIVDTRHCEAYFHEMIMR